jgi:hypothetical protein
VGSNLAKDNGFLKAIKICSMTSFKGQVKPSTHVVRFYGMLKTPAEYDRDTSFDKFKDISCLLPASLLDVSAATREH